MQKKFKNERERQAEFLKRHEEFYDQLVKILADCVERDAVDELSLHIAYLGKIIETTLNLRVMIQRQSGNA